MSRPSIFCCMDISLICDKNEKWSLEHFFKYNSLWLYQSNPLMTNETQIFKARL